MSSRADFDGTRLVLFLFLCPLPVVLSLTYAALYSVGLAGLLGHGFTLFHWRRVLASAELRGSLVLSLSVAAATVFVTTAVALPLALALRGRLTRGPLAHLMTIPLAIPGTAAAFLVLQVFSGAGLVSRVAFRLGLVKGIADFPALNQDPYGSGIVLAHVCLAVPFFVFLFAELYRSETLEAIEELAASLGATPSQTLRRLTLPILLLRGLPNLILLFVIVLGSYEIPLLLGRQSPQMLSVLTLRKYAMFDLAERPGAFVVALVYMALVVCVVGLAFRGRRPSYGL